MTVFLALVIWISTIASVIDARRGILPNRLNLAIFIAAIAWAATRGMQINLWPYLFVVGMHFMMVLVPKIGLGAGDLKLIMGQGLVMAAIDQIFMWLLLAYLLAAIWGVFHLNNRNIRFGPWLTTALMAMLVGEFGHVAMAYSW